MVESAWTLVGRPKVVAGRGVGTAVHGFLWLLLYTLVAVGPLAVALTADPPPGRDFWLELSVGLGFVGLAIMGLQFAVVSRFPSVNAPFGLDVVLHYHRAIAFTAFAFVLAHPAILVIRRPGMARILNPITADWTVRFGLISIAALTLLIAISVWRKQLHLKYEWWRVAHGLLATAIVATALLHIHRVDHYVAGPWRGGLWVVMSTVFVALLVNVRLIRPIRLMRRRWRVTSVTPGRGNTWTLAIAPDGHPGVRFLPGQFAWLRVDRSPFSPHEHPFSFSSSAERTDEVTFTIKEAGDFTSTVGSIHPGTPVYLDGPYGVFSYERLEGPRFVFVAGGVGISPIASMLRTLADRGDRRPCLLLYGSQTWDAVILRDELDELRKFLDLDIVHVLNDPPEGWTGEVGFVDAQLLERHLGDDPERARYFLCGPVPMMDSVQRNLAGLGVPAEYIELERFHYV